MSYSADWKKTHICQRYGEDACPHLLIPCTDGGALNGKKLRRYAVYCTADSKVKQISSCAASWTGLTPRWCKKRETKAACAAANSDMAAPEPSSESSDEITHN